MRLATVHVRRGPPDVQDAGWNTHSKLNCVMAALQAENTALKARLDDLTHQLEWFKRQLFGERSERRLIERNPHQLSLGEVEAGAESAPSTTTSVKGHTRKPRTKPSPEDEPAVRFDDTVPVEVIEVADPQIEDVDPNDLEIISEKVTHRLAQRPGSYVILKYVRHVIKRRDTGTLHCAPAPAGVLERSFADVSFLAGLLTDKFDYHLPLYRQHQRLKAAGIGVSRHWLTQLVHRAGQLLAPIAAARSGENSSKPTPSGPRARPSCSAIASLMKTGNT